MTTEVEWVLTQLKSVVDDQPAEHPLERVNRNNSQFLEGDIRTRKGELQAANYVGASLVNFNGEPIGTEFDQNTESIVGIRIEGLHHHERGHIDPDDTDGTDGVAFDALVRQIKNALQTKREFPEVGHPDITFKSLYLENHAPQSAQWRDYYRYDFDVRLTGHQPLP